MKTQPVIRLMVLCLLFGACCDLFAASGYSLHDAKIIRQADSKEFIPEYVEFDQSLAYQNPDPLILMRQLFGFNSDYDLKLISQDKLSQIVEVKRYQQLYKNIPVENTMYIQVRNSGKVTRMSGTWLTPNSRLISLNVKPAISLNTARDIALAAAGGKNFLWDDPDAEAELQQLSNNPNATYYPEGELVIASAEELLDPADLHLVYKFEVGISDPLDHLLIYIDAITGDVLYNYTNERFATGFADVQTCGHRSFVTKDIGAEYILMDETRGHGVYTHKEGSQDFTNVGTDWSGNYAPALVAHYGAEKTYDYYLDIFERNSIDDHGYQLVSFVRTTGSNTITSWNGYSLIYGNSACYTCTNAPDASVVSIDLAGHEFTHGLIEYTANLQRRSEPGAVGEAICDMFGTAIEYYANCSGDWVFAEEVQDEGYLHVRHMDDPSHYNLPDTYHGRNWRSWSIGKTNNDGDVHRNCAVLDYWFYLFVEGAAGTNDNGDSYNVTGIGLSNIDDAAKIVYWALTNYLWSTADYSDFANAVMQSAKDLHGCSSTQYIECGKALHAVGLGEEVTGSDYDNVGNDTHNISFYHFINGESFVAIKDEGVLLKVAGNGGGGYNMLALECDGGDYSGVGDYGYVLGVQQFNSAITEIAYADGHTFVCTADGRIAKIYGTGGGGQNMFAIEENPQGYQSISGWDYLNGSARFSSYVDRIYYFEGFTIICFTNGKILKVHGTGGGGLNMFAVNETSGGFDPCCGYNYYAGDQYFPISSVVSMINLSWGESIIGFHSGKMLKIVGTGGGGHNMFTTTETANGFDPSGGGTYYLGDTRFYGAPHALYFDGSNTTIGLADGKLLKISGTGGGGHNMFSLFESSTEFNHCCGSQYYIGDAKYNSAITNIKYNAGELFITMCSGKIMKLQGLGGSGHNMYNVSEDAHTFHTTTSGTSYLVGASDLGACITDLDFESGTTIISTLSGKMLKVNGTGGNGDNMFGVTQQLNGFHDLPGYCSYIGSQAFDCSHLRMMNPSYHSNEEISAINIYPNPANDIIHVEFNNPQEGAIKMELFDFTGKLVRNTAEGNLAEGFNQLFIDTHGLQPGVYSLKITGSINESKKVMIIQ